MVDMSDITKSIISEEERVRLIDEIDRIKKSLDSFTYGLEFEKFADEIFKTINRQTVAIKKLHDTMDGIMSRLETLEKRLNQGIKVHIMGMEESELGKSSVVITDSIEDESTTEEDTSETQSREELERVTDELKLKIARLFEKESEFEEMAMTDPASADEYYEKAEVASQMREKLESRLKEVEEFMK
ncbi:MAG: hypothetical protein BAJATHORv1_30428 [Candidatus Thorarchaeota archaeon]|nr:MAG: hypothetical protein BAJATHORv1_30428 [Candidatus Thorarchaeota archaeon]